MTSALICGVSGQDGAYLSELLLGKGYDVVGTSRDVQGSTFKNLERLGIQNSVRLESVAISDFHSVLQCVLRNEPDEIYNLAGQSSVGLSFEQPAETLHSISVGTLNCLEAIRFAGAPIKFYNAGSGESFGDTGGARADENTRFRPRSPYAVAKAAAYWEVANYREAYDLFACTGILFNHESPLRGERFVTKKIVRAACRIARGEQQTLQLGNIKVMRDWGWAPEYVEAMWLMLQQDQPEDLVVGTGTTQSLEYFVAKAFALVGLNWEDFVTTDPSLCRPSDILVGASSPARAEARLGWKAKFLVDDVIEEMVKAEQALEYA